jgi:cytochrome c biogenesis protein CcmG/thiol:disulfide interchange protein DsbE
MKNKLLPFLIVFYFYNYFYIFYKGLQNTNIYTPEKKSNNEIPLFSVKFILFK